MSSVITISQLAKHYQVPEREGGLKASIASLFRRKYKTVKAVDGISFDIGAGEIVGFLGPNGAGKTTTLKMLSGLLHPTSGHVSVMGYEPRHRSHDYLRQITLVMGNRNQLTWDLPALDSFDLQRAVYGLDVADFKRTRDEFIELLDLKDLVTKPVRNLSLGERMKMEIVAALLHKPKVLFLDEPTLGLDVTMQRRIRTFVAEYNQRYNATVLLTSHYMADVEALQIAAFIAALVMGAVMLYCVWLMVTSIAFWVIRVGDIVELFQGLFAAGRWPVSVYPDWLRTGMTFLVPVAFAVTMPAEAITNRLTNETILFAIGLTVFFMALARGVWLLGLRSYSGASA